MYKSVFASLKIALRYALGRGLEQFLPSVKPAERKHVVVDLNKCVGCKLCERICPSDALRMRTDRNDKDEWQVEKFKILQEKCVVCGLCIEACPVNALDLKSEDK